MELTFTAILEMSQHGRGTYCYFVVPENVCILLSDLPVNERGFQSIKCKATVGVTSWETSLFPSEGSYILLMAKKRMAAEDLAVGDCAEVAIRID